MEQEIPPFRQARVPRSFEVPYGQYLRDKERKFAETGVSEASEQGKRYEANTLSRCRIPAHVKVNPRGKLGEMLDLARKYQPEDYNPLTQYIIAKARQALGGEVSLEYFTAVDSPLDYEQGIDGGFFVDGNPITFDLKTGRKKNTQGQADLVFHLDVENVKDSINHFVYELKNQYRFLREYSQARRVSP